MVSWKAAFLIDTTDGGIMIMVNDVFEKVILSIFKR